MSALLICVLTLGALALLAIAIVVLEVLADRMAAFEDVLDIQRRAIRDLADRVEQLEHHTIRHHETVTYN